MLIIDDEPSLAKTLGFLLQDENDITLATSGRQALALLSQSLDYDVLLCDLMMPSVSGMDIFDWLQQAHPGKEAAMIFMTGGTFTPKAAQFVSSIPNPTIDKPFSVETVQEIIRQVASGTWVPPT